jgi:hypothetical protein
MNIAPLEIPSGVGLTIAMTSDRESGKSFDSTYCFSVQIPVKGMSELSSSGCNSTYCVTCLFQLLCRFSVQIPVKGMSELSSLGCNSTYCVTCLFQLLRPVNIFYYDNFSSMCLNTIYFKLEKTSWDSLGESCSNYVCLNLV